jgi:hypothetical protein
MGGHYVTSYTEYILKQERERALQGLDIGIHIDSAIIVDGYIDGAYQYTGYYDFFCEDWRADGRPYPLMNATACQEMGEAVAACEKKGAMCRDSYDVDVCVWAMQSCDQTVGKHFADGVKPGGWNPYDSKYLPVSFPQSCSPRVFRIGKRALSSHQRLITVQVDLNVKSPLFAQISAQTRRLCSSISHGYKSSWDSPTTHSS